MPTGPHNAKSRQVAFRLPRDLDARIAHYMTDTGLTQSQALIALLERGLAGVQDNGIHQDAPELVARLEAIESTVAELQRGPASIPVAEKQGPTKPKAGELHPAHHYLGPMCQRGHEWQDSGQTRYSLRKQECLECKTERARERRAAKKRLPL
jgi:hypothetical protein